MPQDIIVKARTFVQQLFTDKLSKDFVFHDHDHTINVTAYATHLAEQKGLSETEREILELAALFHDTGYTEVYEGHEAASLNIARQFMEAEGYPTDRLEKVLACIEATHPEQQPRNTLEEVLKDADLSNLGGDQFFPLNARLRQEWEVICQRVYDDQEWLEANEQFLKNHQYFTPEAQKALDKGKKKNRKKIKNQLNQLKMQRPSKTPISDSRSAQMMFKTALRNHIDLTNIADNKANMMLSINALIITIAMPLLASNIQDNRYLLLPATILLLTCTLSVIFATLATRPIKMLGSIPLERLRQGATNVFFFGNFFQMNLDQYRSAVNEVVTDSSLLESSIVNDLYYLGRALGNKYTQLRTCYAIFMIGMTLTVVAFAVSFFRSL